MKIDMEALDFSRDSRIKESLLKRIKSEYFGSISDDELSFLNAAGDLTAQKRSGQLLADDDQEK